MDEFINQFTEEETKKIANEFHRVGKNTYLDHAGTTLYSEKQIEEAMKILKENLFCNPHTCKVTGDLVDQVRYRILKHFNTDANKYTVIFTSGTTAALKTVAECFDFGEAGEFYYCQENHTSVLGMRAIVQTKQISVLTKNEILENLETKIKPMSTNNCSNSLVTFSAQCNLSGYKMPLDVIEKIQANGLKNRGKQIQGNQNSDENSKFYVCLDAASYVATNFLDLKKYSPDFVCVSFYKMFGYPTGIGALIVSKRAENVLEKQFYGGGTVKIAMTRENFHEKRDGLSERFEDGTLSFLGVVELLAGFSTHERLIPSKNGLSTLQRISNHVYQLARYCYNSLNNLKHSNGNPLIKFYNHTNYSSLKEQGGICTFNILHPDGSYVGFAEVACIAAIYNIQLRTGCFCNPGACQELLSLSDDDIRKQFQAGHICSDYNDLVNGMPTGAVRVSFGYMTAKSDVDNVLNMVKENYLKSPLHRIEKMSNFELPKALKHIPNRLKKNMSIILKKICIYPIKSCGAYDILDSWEIAENGFKYDRTWMIVDSNGMAVTQKITSKMCLIMPKINLKTNQLELNYPGANSIEIPLQYDSSSLHVEASLCQSKVCGDLVEGADCGDTVASWLSECLEISGLRLIQQSSERKNRNGVSKEISLANQSQFLLINYTSVSWLTSKIEDWIETDKEDIDSTVDRFRANLLIETPQPLEENDFKQITIGDVEFKVDGFCTRCQMICIDQRTGIKTTEPLKTIAKEFQGKIRFGIYLSQSNKSSSSFISCNDKILIEK